MYVGIQNSRVKYMYDNNQEKTSILQIIPLIVLELML